MTKPSGPSTVPEPIPLPPTPSAALGTALRKIDDNLASFTEAFPHDTTRQGTYAPRVARLSQSSPGWEHAPDGANIGWTTSFWTGQLWLAYELTGEGRYRVAAERQVESFAGRVALRADIETHDLGFLYTLSCTAAHRVLGSETGRRAALLAADLLMERYLPHAGVIQAWGDLNDPSLRGRAIIDCLMNLPLLHWASVQSGDPRYRDAAVTHAGRTLQHMVRPDHTTFHTYYFDPESGAPRFGRTAQGVSDGSCWSRGQAWGIYGFALAHASTGNHAFLRAACDLAEYFLARTPEDGVAYWDLVFTDGSGEEKDSSATAIAACGLLELSAHVPGETGARYGRAARRMLDDLAVGYATRDGDGSDALLLHGVYDKPRGVGVDEGNLWGDYFYLEALARAERAWPPYWLT